MLMYSRNAVSPKAYKLLIGFPCIMCRPDRRQCVSPMKKYLKVINTASFGIIMSSQHIQQFVKSLTNTVTSKLANIS